MAAPQRIVDRQVETVSEGGRWWPGAGWRADSTGFRVLADPLQPLPDAAKADTAKLLAAANANAPAGSRWFWAAAGWTVAADGNTEAGTGFTYSTDWPNFARPRDGGRGYQRVTDKVRRRRLTRERVLCELADNPTPPEVAAQIGAEADPAGGVAALKLQYKVEKAAKKVAEREVLAAILTMFKKHVVSRSLADQPMDPTAWYRLSNTHAAQMATLCKTRPLATAADDDIALIRELAVGIKLANAAYGFAAEQMVSIRSNVKMHTSKFRGGVDVAMGVDDAVNTAKLLELTGIEEPDLLYTDWHGDVRFPAFYIAAVREEKWIVLGIRGTLNPADGLTDADAIEVPFLGGVAHRGFAQAAEAIVQTALPVLLAAAAKYEGYTLVVTGHSLGGCTAQTVALASRAEDRKLGGGDEGTRTFLTQARCMAFAGTAVATPDLQQSAESMALTVSVIFGADMVPRLGVKSAVNLLDELNEHGVVSMLKEKLVGGAAAGHHLKNFPFWRGLPNSGKCQGTTCGGKKSVGKYCSQCFLCEACALSSGFCAAAAAPEPEAASPAITPLALGGRVLWAHPGWVDDTISLHWCQSADFDRLVASLDMLAHHLPSNYMKALGAPAAAAGPTA
eukprot:SAG22_NODE_874_length_6717_cov_3.925808_1_plen_621_part_00